MIVTVFRSRLNEGSHEEYGPLAKKMSQLAREMSGYISHKAFVAEDGERVTIVEFESEEALQAWRTNRDHAQAKKRGFDSLFASFKYQICTVIHQREWVAKVPAIVE